MRLSLPILVAFFMFANGVQASPETEPLVLVKNGVGRAVLVLPLNADGKEKSAANELVAYIEKISGAKLPIVTEGEPVAGDVRILLGAAAGDMITPEEITEALGPRNDEMNGREGFVIKTRGNTLAIRGVRSVGISHGVYEVLERLGCRWFWPGPMGEVVPRNKTVALPRVNDIQSPSFDMRTFWFSGDHGVGQFSVPWSSRVRLSHNYGHSSAHTPHPDIKDPKASEIKANEILASGGGGKWVSLGWADNYAFVTKEQAKGRPHEWNPEVYYATDTLMAYYNGVAERVTAKHKDKLFGFLAYMNYLMPPTANKVHPSLSPMIAPIEQCPLHVPYSGKCWERDLLFDAIKTWGGLSRKVFIYDYEPGFLVSGNIPWPCVTRQKVEIPLLYKYGVRGFLHQSQLSIMNQGPNLYIMAKLMWDAGADVNALLDDYYSKLFGPAAESVRTYWDRLEEMVHNSPVHQHEDEIAKIVYPIEKIKALGKFVSQAETLAQTGIVRQRLQVIRYGYDNLMLYLRMRQAEDQADFALAVRLAQQQRELHEEADNFDTVIYKMGDLNENNENRRHLTGGYVTQNNERLVRTDGTKGRLVDMLPESWAFRTDSQDRGIKKKWYLPGIQSSDHRQIRITRVWEAEGLLDGEGHGYDGPGWYRTDLTVPEQFAGKKVLLNFGGVFGSMMIWLDGKLVAERPYKDPWWINAYNTSFDVDISEAVTPGRKSVLVIRVVNDFEWGGIFRRVFAWSPN